MNPAPPSFQVMAKPTGARCNLDCAYCFFLRKERLYPGSAFRMSDEVLESYIRQTLAAHGGPEVSIAWQGGEPTLMGLDFFRRAVDIERAALRPGLTVGNTLQTNGVLLDDEWCEFLRQNRFLVGLSLDGPRELHDAYRRDKAGNPVFDKVVRAVRLMQKHQVEFNVLCTVNAVNSQHPLEVYRFFRDELGARYLQFIPIVEKDEGQGTGDEAGTSDQSSGTSGQWSGVRGQGPLVRGQGAGGSDQCSEGGGQGSAEPPAVAGHADTRTAVSPLDPRPSTLGGPQTSVPLTERSVRPEQYGRFLIGVFDEWVAHDVGSVFVPFFDAVLASYVYGESSLCVLRPTCGDALVLEHNGDLYSCDHFVEPRHRLGNITQTPLADLVLGARQYAFGQAKSLDLPKVCRECRFLFTCHGECPKNRVLTTPDGEPGLNWLCAGLKAFFEHTEKPMQEMARLLRSGRYADEIMQAAATQPARGPSGDGIQRSEEQGMVTGMGV